jgi:tetratricopeptide (TPR) repeat protein
MDSSSQKGERKKKITEVKIFSVPFDLGEIKENITITTNTPSNPSKEQIINQAFKFHSQGNISEAAKYYQYFINQGYKDHRVFSNYGVILKNLGKLKEAERCQRKAIQIQPDYADAHSNLGNLLRGLGQLQDAELSTRKAIQLNSDFADAHLNLGNVLSDLGELQEAEKSFRKAIQLNPDFAEAHSNLGTILKDLGKLQDAELSTRKAIEIKPDYAEAHLNLATILKDLGKLQELILLSKSTLESNSINQGYKLRASLLITIAHLIRGNFPETLLNINKTNDLINQGAINTIKDEKNRKYSSTFCRYIKSLYPLLEKENKHPDSKEIPHFGESHSLSFAHQNLSISSQVKTIQPVLITGGKAWHFANNKDNKWKDSLTQQIKNHTYSNEVFISFGEIDCRKDEGILYYAIKNDKDISEVCQRTITGYLSYMEEILSSNYSKKYYFGIPAPTREKELPDELDIKRIEMVKIYNSLLKQEVLSRGSHFLDIYELTSNKNGENNNIHMCDDTHLSPKCLSILFENHLYKPENFVQ